MSEASVEERLKGRREFFSRPMPAGYAEEWAERLRQPEEAAERRSGSVLVFRIAKHTLGLRTAFVKAIVEPRVVCPVPHRLNTAFLGLVAFSGEILPCCSLARMLGLADNTEGPERRTLILQDIAGLRWALPIDAALAMTKDCAEADEVDGEELPAGWQNYSLTDESGRKVLILNPETLFHRLARATG